MNALENLLIIAGISLDIFAAMECQGSLVATDCCMADGSAVRRKLPVRTFVP